MIIIKFDEIVYKCQTLLLYMLLKKIKIKKLHENFDYNLKFNKDINLLYGLNGTGKTTILNIIQNILNVDFEDAESVTAINILSINGQVLKNKNNNILQKNALDINNLTPGVYFLQILYTNQKQHIERLLKF